MTVEALISEAAKLSHGERAELIEELIRMMGSEEEIDTGLTPAQRIDLGRRLAEYKAGNAELIDGPEAMARLRSRK